MKEVLSHDENKSQSQKGLTWEITLETGEKRTVVVDNLMEVAYLLDETGKVTSRIPLDR